MEKQQVGNSEFILRVAKTSNSKSLASAVARELEKNSSVSVRAIGVQAINQAVKGIAIAGGFLGQKGKSIVVRIGFTNINMTEEQRVISAVNFDCKVE